MNQETLISIVIPAYNSSQYLNECIDSILTQTYQNIEIIIVDDGSTDNSVEVIKSYNDNRICLICNNHDYIHSLNLGMNKARGKYIARMDADDIMQPNRLQIQYDFMENHPEIDISGSWMEMFGDRTDIARGPTEHKEIISSLLLNNTLAHPTVIMRKSSVCVNGINLYKENYEYAEDYKLWTDLALRGLHFAVIPKILLRYRISEKQVSNTRKAQMGQLTAKIRMEYAEQVMELILVKYPQYEDVFDALVTLFNNDCIAHRLLLKTVYNFYKESLLSIN